MMKNKDAIQLLKDDHDTVRALLGQLAETTTRAKQTRVKLLSKINKEILIHSKIEEEIFYPAFRKSGADEAEKMYFEAREEHRVVEKLVLPDLNNTDPVSEQFSGRVKVLKDLIEHHAKEEEKEMFPAARKAMEKDHLIQLGQRLFERKQELEGQLDEQSLIRKQESHQRQGL